MLVNESPFILLSVETFSFAEAEQGWQQKASISYKTNTNLLHPHDKGLR